MTLNKFGMYAWGSCTLGWFWIATKTGLTAPYLVAVGCGIIAMWHSSLEEEE
jgi:hypothetical protein